MTTSRPLPFVGLVLVFMACAPCLPLCGQDPVAEALESLDAALMREQGLSAETRGAMRKLVQSLREDRQNAGPSSLPYSALEGAIQDFVAEHGDDALLVARKAAAAKCFSWSGDFRLRHESRFGSTLARTRHRQRIRLRLNLGFDLGEEMKIGARLVTGDPDDPNSPHQTLGSVYDKFDVSLDRAYWAFEPTWAEGTRLVVGKFGNPFHRNPVYGELTWDADVQPEGALLSFGHRTPDDVLRSLDVHVGAFHLLEQGNGSDSAIWAGQVSCEFALSESTSLEVSSAYYHVGNTQPDGSTSILGDNAGNRTVDRSGNGTADAFLSEFGILDSVAAVQFELGDVPITVVAEAIWNLRADEGRDFGWACGASAGKSSDPGDFRGYYSFQVVEQDAVFSPLAQDDFLYQTNHCSHVVGANYMLGESTGLHLWALVSRLDSPGPGIDDGWAYRVRLDLNFKF